MNEVFSLAAFVGKLLCLVVFVSVLKPSGISAVQASDRPAYCKTGTLRAYAPAARVLPTRQAC